MDSDAMKRSLISRLLAMKTSEELDALGRKWAAENAMRGLSDDEANEVRKAYKSRLAQLLVEQLGGGGV
jgi:uncharacterized protein